MTTVKSYSPVLEAHEFEQFSSTWQHANFHLFQAQRNRFFSTAEHSSWLLQQFESLIAQVTRDFELGDHVATAQFVLETLGALPPVRTVHRDIGCVIMWNLDTYPHSCLVANDVDHAFVANCAVAMASGVAWRYAEPIDAVRRSVWIYLSKQS
jgi:hypothetical protein